MMKQTCIIVAVVLGLAVANGLFMLASPANWYFAATRRHDHRAVQPAFPPRYWHHLPVPGRGVPDRRVPPEFRVVLWTAATLWLCCHALFPTTSGRRCICGAVRARLRRFWRRRSFRHFIDYSAEPLGHDPRFSHA